MLARNALARLTRAMYLAQYSPVPWRIKQFLERSLLEARSWGEALENVTLSQAKPRVRLLALGDVCLTRPPSFDARDIFGDLFPLFETADIRTANLEAAFTSRKTPAGTIGSRLRADPAGISILTGAHIDVVNVANNHALDFGSAGFADSLGKLKEADVDACGVSSADATSRLTTRMVNDLRIGFIGFCDDHCVVSGSEAGPSPALASEASILQTVRASRDKVDTLVVHLHWGYEFSLHPLLSHRDLARKTIDAGATVVLCHHAHVPMGIERWAHGVIAHGLGNALMPHSPYLQEGHPWTDRSFVIEIGLTGAGVGSLTLHPFRITSGGRIQRLRGRAKQALLSGIARISKRLDAAPRLRALEHCRALYETFALLNALDAAASRSKEVLQERALRLRILRQQRLIAYLNELPELGATARELKALAAEAGDAKTTSDRFMAACPLFVTAMAALLKQYEWLPALHSRVP